MAARPERFLVGALRYPAVQQRVGARKAPRANTGLRPDEASSLQFRDVSVVHDDSTHENILEIEVRGKRGVGYCKSMPAAVRVFERLKARNVARAQAALAAEDASAVPQAPAGKKRRKSANPRSPDPTDLLFPRTHRDLLNAILDEEGLKTDRDGRPRTAYSLRHTYICLRLMEGADIYQIAKNCRTSVEMIEKYYATHIKTRLDAASINRMRSNEIKYHFTMLPNPDDPPATSR